MIIMSLGKALICLCFLVIVKANIVGKKCYNVDLEPTERKVLNHNFDEFESRLEMRGGEIYFHLFDESGKVLMASNAATSRVCIDDDEDACFHWYFNGNGFFNVTHYNFDKAEEAFKEGTVSFDNPELIEMGDCRHYCGDQQHQLTFAGLMEDEPILYDHNKKVVDSLFYKVHEDKDKKKQDNNEVVVKTSCIKPTECYNLVGSALYIVTTDDNKIQEKGDTLDGAKTFGDESKCRNHCDSKPLLGSTRRGIEFLKVASSVSSSDALIDVASPQYRAACWLIYDDARQLQSDDYNVLQRYILAVIFYASGGDEWYRGFDFLTSKHECQWHKWVYHVIIDAFRVGDDNGDGVHCNQFGYVTGLVLGANHLVGTIPFEIGSLMDMKYIQLWDNILHGSIPLTLGNLQQLRYIDIQANALTGSIPESMGGIKRLTLLSMGDNFLTGTIPSLAQDFFNFDVRRNMLSGRIPENIGRWTSLWRLLMQGNQLSGTIPEGISKLTLLYTAYLFNNNLVGTIPSRILTLPRLWHLWLFGNFLTGSIPSHVAIDSPLAALYLFQNRLTGQIPTELSLLGNLQYVQFDNNRLSGAIPTEFTNLQNLGTFTVNNNNITGNSPFQDCEESPLHMEADCDTPEKVSCPCCTACHGIFTSHDDELACTSGELTILLENLDVGDYLQFQITNNAGKLIDYAFFAAQNTTHRHTICVTISGCFRIYIYNFLRRKIVMKLIMNQGIFLEELINEENIFYFGFSSINSTIQKDACDTFELCDAPFQVNSTNKRDLLDKLVRITGAQVFDDTSSSYHKAACDWVNYLEGVENEDEYKYRKLLQYFYLTLFYYETNGNEWMTSDLWVTNATFCSWYGIQCDSYGTVTSIRLSANNLRGSLPTEIGELRGLEHILLDHNRITGTLPLEIGVNLAMLKQFNISQNGLWGSIPDEYVRLHELVELDASHNRLTGSLPEDIGYLSQLRVLNIVNNTCGGRLPETFHDLQGLKSLSLGSNLFDGSARKVQQLLNLEILDLSQNFFTGSVPVGSSQKHLRVFQLSGNQFRGSMPISIDQLESLETLHLYNNLLTGNLPSEIGNLGKLAKVSISHNAIKGSLPFEFGRLKHLTFLHLQDNELEGSGDVFSHKINDYITDCGHTFTGATRVKCISCTSCCNIEGDCMRRKVTWPKPRLEVLRIQPHRFVFVMILVACLLLLIPMGAAAKHMEDDDKDFQHCREFQTASVYKFLITDSIAANVLAIGTVSIQLMPLSVFLLASDFSAEKNDWQYSMSCPNDSTDCEDSRFITYLAWLGYTIVLSLYFATDFAGSIKMMYKAFLLKSPKCGITSLVVLYVTVCSGVTSCLYVYSTSISSTQILKDSVILFFLNELDEKLYELAEVVCPGWIKQRNDGIKKLLDDKIEAVGGNIVAPEGENNNNNGDPQDLQDANGNSQEEGEASANSERVAGYMRAIREQRDEIHALQVALARLEADNTQLQDRYEQLHNSHQELMYAREELENYFGYLGCELQRNLSEIKTIASQKMDHASDGAANIRQL